jgi:decaprenylphospho-beta-D-ribofuranose 2-oxidase
MPQADLAVPAAVSETTAIGPVLETIHGWGGGGGVRALVLHAPDSDAVRAAVQRCRPASGDGMAAGVLARGLGRSYGDAAQLAGGLVIDMTRMNAFRLDRRRGTVTAQAGVTIGELLRELVPAGWMVPVVPGTQHVTVGGAIASDIHGKNHDLAGTFGRHVRALGLLTAAGDVLELTPAPGDELFAATVGGMGLTGVILYAEIALQPVSSPQVTVDRDRAPSLDDALALLSRPGGAHRVAWLDLLGRHPGRGVVTRAEHLEEPVGATSGHGGATLRARAKVPERWPSGVLRASTVTAFNELRFRRTPRHQRGRVETLGAHLFQLDTLQAWPRLYGRHGMLQYQFAVPAGRDDVLAAVIERLRRANVPCFLAVLKHFGDATGTPLSFPLAGWTLALDLPRAAAGIYPTLDRCDQLVAEAGGRVYLTKDARLRPDTVKAMYPRLAEWRAVRDRADPEGLWRSDLALRTGLISADIR